MSELKPCPFCGQVTHLEPEEFCGRIHIMCDYCGARGPAGDDAGRLGGENTHTKDWNTRPEERNDYEYSMGFDSDGVVILKDGQPMKPEEIIAEPESGYPAQWISVDERLPEEPGEYMVVLENDRVTTSLYYGDEDCSWNSVMVCFQNTKKNNGNHPVNGVLYYLGSGYSVTHSDASRRGTKYRGTPIHFRALPRNGSISISLQWARTSRTVTHTGKQTWILINSKRTCCPNRAYSKIFPLIPKPWSSRWQAK